MSSAAKRPLIARPSQGLLGRALLPGDKSLSHRALMFGLLAAGESRIEGLLEGADVMNTAGAVTLLGANCERLGSSQWCVQGRGIGALTEPADVLDMGNSGTAARLLLGILAGHPIFAVMTGDASLRGRPMGRVSGPLGEMGAQISTREGGRLPLAIKGAPHTRAITYKLPVASAQVKSAILLAGLNAQGKTTVIEPEPTRDHTERLLRYLGAEVEVEDSAEGRHIFLTGQPELKPGHFIVPGDPSSAAFPAVAALLLDGSEITLPSVGINPFRTGLYTTLKEMGADLSFTNQRDAAGEPIADLVVKGSKLKGVEVPAERAPSMIDEYPILAVAASLAEGRTVMRGLSELRVKESDRLSAVAAGLKANGVKVEEGKDFLIVEGNGKRAPGGGTVATHMDHRIAMSFLVMGLASEKPVGVDDGAFIDTSFPGFVTLMNSLGAKIEAA